MFWISNLFHSKNLKKLSKKPEYILIIDSFETTNIDKVKYLKNKYQIKEFKILLDMDSPLCLKNDLNATKLELFPDLIILCSDTLRFYLKDPLILYKAEIWHSRSSFSEKVFEDAIKHFDKCEIRNGK